ncbi:MAG TPA: sugar ABC transporter permease [Candidatus Sumerlaeota bacterium]|nr:MAG: Lactose transport system permease protein LacF [candidate division BRC1 bacterium ADurb.Bin183]HOE64113.1 sugar ABC transporter permease [Candidatus Sumerlaeota bacterium]HRR31093.1 sugar ABC transporter permease [Candidatus Sumerlaeia bacterium]HON51316.1 sugar ABC transporter permease [Candidatus Sumerlaeota bacterium]HOR65694.1 sugar ABC transporter permease [Candidatus Sumerlaeota bacterium]
MRFSGSRLRQIFLAYLFLLPTLIILSVFLFYPMLRAFLLSLWDYSPLSPDNKFVGLDNFIRLSKDADFWRSLGNSFLYLIVVPIIIILSLALALLVEPKIPFVNFFRAAYYMPVVTMMVVVALVWKMIFDTDHGILNSLLSRMSLISENVPWLTSPKLALFTVMTVTIWKGLGYYMVIFIAGLRSIPHELLEAAMIDGCKSRQTLLHVKIPMLWPSITLVAIISSISALQVFEEIYMMTQGRLGTSTLVFYIYDLGVRGEQEMGYACAMGVALFCIIFIFTFFNVRLMGKAHKI